MICIFPEDSTLGFLKPLIDKVSKEIEVIHLKNENIDTVIERLDKLPSEIDILFIGHGASHCLYGAISNNEKTIFINSSNINILSNKNIVTVTCRSSEFLHSNKEILNNYLGFGNIPSDWSEVMTEREYNDVNYLYGIEEEDLEYYILNLIKILTLCIVNFTSHKSVEKLYFELRLYFNKQITKLLKEKNIKKYNELAELFINTKNEINYFMK